MGKRYDSSKEFLSAPRKDKCNSVNENYIQLIYRRICEGLPFSKIIEEVESKGVTNSNAKRLYTTARKRLKEDFEAEREELRELMISRLMDIYNEARECKDRFAALNALNSIAKITNLEDKNNNQNIEEVNIKFKF